MQSHPRLYHWTNVQKSRRITLLASRLFLSFAYLSLGFEIVGLQFWVMLWPNLEVVGVAVGRDAASPPTMLLRLPTWTADGILTADLPGGISRCRTGGRLQEGSISKRGPSPTCLIPIRTVRLSHLLCLKQCSVSQPTIVNVCSHLKIPILFFIIVVCYTAVCHTYNLSCLGPVPNLRRHDGL